MLYEEIDPASLSGDINEGEGVAEVTPGEPVIDEYGFDVDEEGIAQYQKEEKKRIMKEIEHAKRWEILFLKYKRRDDELFNSSKFKKLVEKGIPVQYPDTFLWFSFSLSVLSHLLPYTFSLSITR